ncbi:Eco57I restriction-modification methylase domain-containing protein [Photobacterium damselae]|uniref:Eco57I restriction-modification methylase domain-containing protein n=1 Tax=Photobacterium damselae TaxID=38293 RepID=UPI0015E68ABE|nr:Eco57I restriction-modification methylase domain-containing protein [Photobacterium damselae]
MQLATSKLQTQSLLWGESSAEKGEVFTKPEIVNLMLVASGVVSNLFSIGTRILEPSCGQGEFVVAIAKHIKISYEKDNVKLPFAQLVNLVRAYDISSSNLEIARSNVRAVLSDIYTPTELDTALKGWFIHEDFLLTDIDEKFTHIVGNPPYIRIETIPSALLAEYRNRFVTMIERADIYIAFYEKCLDLLSSQGVLSFICTDRWTKNRYGAGLRNKIAASFQLDLFIDLYGQKAFMSDVMTYPAITQLSKNKQKRTCVLHNPNVTHDLSDNIQKCLTDTKLETLDGAELIVRNDLVKEDKPWLFGTVDELEMLSRIERQFPTLEEAGCFVYIGAATGSNKIYIVDEDLNIEASRKIPVITAKELKYGAIESNSKCIINTYDDNGVIELEQYPLLRDYFLEFESVLKSRHIAKIAPKQWFKTIDRVYPERAAREKLLIPDIKSELTVIFDDGSYHPNNSIYYICSATWNLNALRAVLLSGIGHMFVQKYSTKVSGGNLRFQAQHLRKIRLPFWNEIDSSIQTELTRIGRSMDVDEAKALVAQIYSLNEKEKQILGM